MIKSNFTINTDLNIIAPPDVSIQFQATGDFTRNSLIENKYISFDRSLHTTLSEYNRIKNNQDVRLPQLLNLLLCNWISKGYESVNEELSFQARAMRILKRYYAYPLDIGTDSLIIDKFLKEQFSKNILLLCKIDKLNELPGGKTELIDYKTGRRLPPMSCMFCSTQIPIYLTLIYCKYGFYPSLFSYYFLNYNLKFTLKIDYMLIRKVNNYMNSLLK